MFLSCEFYPFPHAKQSYFSVPSGTQACIVPCGLFPYSLFVLYHHYGRCYEFAQFKGNVCCDLKSQQSKHMTIKYSVSNMMLKCVDTRIPDKRESFWL